MPPENNMDLFTALVSVIQHQKIAGGKVKQFYLAGPQFAIEVHIVQKYTGLLL